MMSISTTLLGEISHASLFLLASCGTLGRCSRNPGVPRNPGWKTLPYAFSISVNLRYIMHAL